MSIPTSFKSLHELLRHVPGLQSLAETVNATKAHNDLVAKSLGPPLNAHVTLSKVTAHSIVLIADSPVWATRARFQATALQQCLQASNPQTTPQRITVITRPNAGPPSTEIQPAKRQAKIPIDLLRDIALTLDNEPLRETLLRMSKGESTMDKVVDSTGCKEPGTPPL